MLCRQIACSHFESGSCRYLDLTGNRLHSLGALSVLPALHTLLLSGNKIATFSDCQSEAFQHLEVLDISFNSVQPSDIAVLGCFPQLRQLDVSGKGVAILHTHTLVVTCICTNIQVLRDVFMQHMQPLHFAALGRFTLPRHVQLSNGAVLGCSSNLRTVVQALQLCMQTKCNP